MSVADGGLVTPYKNLDFPLIDVLRGFAAVSVIVLHTVAHAGWVDFPSSGLLGWFRQGARGVDLFFVISGFVIYLSAHTLWVRYHAGYLWRFALRRAARLAPLHWVTCILALVTVNSSVLQRGDWWTHLLLHLGFVHTWNYDAYSSINGVNWSIAIEAQFYLLIALTLPLLMRLSSPAILICGCLIAWSWRWGAATVTPAGDDYLLFTRYSQLPGLLDTFAFGVVLAKFTIDGGIDRLRAHPYAVSLVSLAAVVLVWLFAYPGTFPFLTREGYVTFQKTGIGLAFMFVVLAACLLSDRGLLFSATAPLRFLGEVSYGLYLWHLPVLLALKDRGIAPALLLTITLLCTLLLATLSHHFLEKPIMRIARGLTNRTVESGQDVKAT